MSTSPVAGSERPWPANPPEPAELLRVWFCAGFARTIFLAPNPNVVYSAALMSKVEQMFQTGKATYPVERTLLTSGLVEAGMQSLAAGQKRQQTPHLNVRYQVPKASHFWRS